MKSSFCTIGFQKNKWGRDRQVEKPLNEILPILSEAGFDGVEIWAEHYTTLDSQACEIVHRQLREYGLEVVMISPYFNFATSDETAEASMKQAREILEHARRLGSRGIRVFTGGGIGSQQATQAQWDRTVRCLQQLADESRDDDLVWACETHANNLMDDVDGSLRLIKEVKRKNVRLIFQPSTFGDDYMQALDLLGPYIVHVHATNSKDGKKAALEDGDMDYAQIVSGLRRYSFDGFISIEWMGEDPEGMARREREYLGKLLG